MSSVKEWLQDKRVKHQEVELIQSARQKIVARHDRLRPRIWHPERDGERGRERESTNLFSNKSWKCCNIFVT